MKSIVDTEIPKKIPMILKTLSLGESIDIIYQSKVIGTIKPINPPRPPAMKFFGKTRIASALD